MGHHHHHQPAITTIDSLTQFQHQKLAELRDRLGEQLLQQTPLYNDPFSLLRWLQAWNYRVDEILPRFKRASSVFHCMGINELPLIEDTDALNDFVRSLISTAEFVPGGLIGFDREGNIVGFQHFGQFHPGHVHRCARNSDAYRLSIVETAMIYKLLQSQERKHGKKLGICGLADVKGCNSEHLAVMHTFRPMMQTIQEIFPDLLHKGYMLNTHPLVRTAFKLVKSWLPEQSRDKIVLFDSHFHHELVQDIGAENLYPLLGGTKQPVRGHPDWGTLRLGGEPPMSLRYLPAANPLHMKEQNLAKLIVPPRQRREIEVQIPEDGQPYCLRWFWHCHSDIDFGIVNEENEEIWPILRLFTDKVPEYGSIILRCGLFKLIFDNTFSMFTKKELKFGFTIVPSDEKEIIVKN